MEAGNGLMTLAERMEANKFDIVPYEDQYRQQVLAVWERSVLATHDFLTQADFAAIREEVSGIDFNDFEVFCLENGGLVPGFVGVADGKIEMLFVDPGYFGRGLGLALLQYAVVELGADKVDVNEQNGKALRFYESFGFETFERSDKDDQGRGYPLLRMKFMGYSRYGSDF